MFDIIEDQRYKVGKKFFIYAPPFKGRRSKTTGEFISRRLQRITPPFRDAEAWQCSVYYFWWEFLRRHEGYQDCCIRGGKGQCKKLYADFGNIHEHDDFWKWWAQKVDDEFYSDLSRGERLFSEPEAGKIELAERSLNNDNDDVVVYTKHEKGTIFKNKSNKFEVLINGTIPKNILSEKITVCRIGYGCAVRPGVIRSGNLFNGKIGTIMIKNNNYFTEINSTNFDDLSNKLIN